MKIRLAYTACSSKELKSDGVKPESNRTTKKSGRLEK